MQKLIIIIIIYILAWSKWWAIKKYRGQGHQGDQPRDGVRNQKEDQDKSVDLPFKR